MKTRTTTRSRITRPHLETLEGRIAPATFTVTNNNNSGSGSLRQAVTNANNAAGADLIEFSSHFSVPRTITLTSEIAISGPVTIDGTSAANVTVSGNNAFRIFNAQSAPTGTAIGLVDLTLTAGTAVDGYGGAVLVDSGALSATRCLFTANTAGSVGFSGPGGAVAVYGDGSLTATDCVFTANRATADGLEEFYQSAAFGGAIYMGGSGSTTVLTRCEVTGNTAQDGGGLHIAGSLLVEASTISGNLATGVSPTYGGPYPGFGGGVRATGATTVRNSTISGNGGAVGAGGGIWSSSTLLIQNSTVAGNSVTGFPGFGGGIFSGTVTLESSIIANNTANYDGRDIRASTVNARTSSIFSRSGITTFNDLGGNRPAGEDPRLGPLQSNGGTTRTHLLLPGSPCLNAGSNPANLAIDQRGAGFPRVLAGTADMGAVESLDTTPTATAIGVPTTVSVAGATSYTVVVRYNDDIGIDLATIDLGDITVSGPGYAVPQAPTVRSIAGSGQVVTVTYTVPAPGGAFDFFDAGLYTVAMAADQVRDLDAPVSHFVAAGPLGSFRVAIQGTLVVDEPSDVDDGNVTAGHLSLREAVRLTNAAVGTADTITFDPTVFASPRTLVLTSGEFAVSDPLSVVGPGAGLLTLNAAGASRHFTSSLGAALSLAGLTLTNGSGGSIWANTGLSVSDVVIDNCQWVNGFGGGVRVNGALTMRDCVVRNNKVLGVTSGGGGVSVFGGPVVIERSSIIDNQANGDGGGILIGYAGLVRISDSAISGNRSNLQGVNEGGGGICISISGSLAAGSFIRNSTISGNAAANGNSGGGMRQYAFGTLAIENCTITGNSTTGRGGGIAGNTNLFNDVGRFSLSSTIIAGNSAGDGPDLFNTYLAGAVPGNNNLVGIADSGSFILTGNGNLTGTVAAPLNPLLGPLVDNGGPTQTHALLPGSPALDAGNNAAALATDQRGGGFVRVSGPAADIGAFEAQPSAPRVQGVAVNGGAAQRSRVTSLTVTFTTQVTFAGAVADAFTVSRFGGSAVGSFTATSSIVGGVTVVTLNGFTGNETEFGSLRDGRYTLTVLASHVSANGQQMAGNVSFGDAQGLYRFFGDANGDRRIDISDFGPFSATYGRSSSDTAFNAIFDFNNDGRIDITDFGQFSVRFFTNLP